MWLSALQHGGAKIAKLQLRMSLYDSTYRQFFGRTWIGPFIDVKQGSKLAYNQVQCCSITVLIRRSTQTLVGILRNQCWVVEASLSMPLDCVNVADFKS